MQETQHITHADDEIDLNKLFRILWQGKWFIFFSALLFMVVSVFYALSLPNIYKSEVTLASVSEDVGLKIPGQLGGLAALAGVNLGGMGGGDKASLALEILRSREFIGRFIEQNDLYLPIMAAKGWSRSDDRLLLDPKVYSEQTQQWVRKVTPPFQPKPSNLEAFEAFQRMFSINQDKASGMVRLSIEHYSPILAKTWLDKLVHTINEEMRIRELTEAEKSIEYLNDQIAQTNVADLRAMLYLLIEEQTKTVMLANVRSEYLFKTIDSAVVAEKKVKPARALICILGTMLGGMLSILIVFIRYFLIKNQA